MLRSSALLSRAASAALPFAAFALSASAANAQQVLLSNLDTPPGTGGTTLNVSQQKAIAFTTGGTDYTLSSVSAYLALDTVATGNSNLSFALYTPATVGGNDPGVLVADLGTQAVTTSRADATIYTFAPSSLVTLAANTRYVLLADYVSGNAGSWLRGAQNTLPTARNGSGYLAPVYRLSNNNGSTYADSTTYNQFAISGSAVTAAAPEPGTIALLLTAGVPVAGLFRRRKKH